VLFKVHKKRVL